MNEIVLVLLYVAAVVVTLATLVCIEASRFRKRNIKAVMEEPVIRQQRIVSPAVKMADGLVFMTCREDIPKHLRDLLQLRYGPEFVTQIETSGFMTSDERFVSGIEAWDIAEKSGQIRYNRDQIKKTKQELWSIYLY
jgi:hypothetical protein